MKRHGNEVNCLEYKCNIIVYNIIVTHGNVVIEILNQHLVIKQTTNPQSTQHHKYVS